MQINCSFKNKVTPSKDLWKRECPPGHFPKYMSCMSMGEEHAFLFMY